MTPSTHYSMLNALKDPEGIDDAWERFQNRYQATIRSWCERHLQFADAEDATQKILIKLYRKLPDYEYDPDRAKFRSFLRTVVLHAVRDHQRERQGKSHKFAIGGDAIHDEAERLEAPVDALIGPFEEQLDSDLRSAVDHVRKQVREEEWQAFFQTVEQKLSIAEVARLLSMPIASVYQARHKVRTMLRQEYGHKMK